MQLTTSRLRLRDLLSTDLAAVHHLHSLPEVDQFNTLGLPASLATTEHLLRDWLVQQAVRPRTAYVFCLERIDTGEFVGLMALNLGKATSKGAEVWYKLLPSHWGRGFATEALRELLRFGFADLQLHRIEAGCAVENVASIRVLERVGMSREGRKRQVLPIRGQWVDNYFFAILDTDT